MILRGSTHRNNVPRGGAFASRGEAGETEAHGANTRNGGRLFQGLGVEGG